MPSFIIVRYVWQVLGRGGFLPPSHPWAAPKKPILNRVKVLFIFNIVTPKLFMWKLNVVSWRNNIKGRFSIRKMTGDFTAKYIWACALTFVYNLSSEIWPFKKVKMNLINLQQKIAGTVRAINCQQAHFHQIQSKTAANSLRKIHMNLQMFF